MNNSVKQVTSNVLLSFVLDIARSGMYKIMCWNGVNHIAHSTGELIMPKLVELVTTIVAGQSSQRTLSGEEITDLIRQTYRALKEIETLESAGGSLEEIDKSIGIETATPKMDESSAEPAVTEPKINPRESIQDDKIVCIECGQSFQTLAHTHLRSHGLTPAEYKKKWGIKEPLSAKSISDRRKQQAKERNLGEQLKMARARAKSSRGSSTSETGTSNQAGE